jgi:hypothetical protein
MLAEHFAVEVLGFERNSRAFTLTFIQVIERALTQRAGVLAWPPGRAKRRLKQPPTLPPCSPQRGGFYLPHRFTE